MIFACRTPRTPATLVSRTDGLDMQVSTRQKQGATRHKGAGAKGDNSAPWVSGSPPGDPGQASARACSPFAETDSYLSSRRKSCAFSFPPRDCGTGAALTGGQVFCRIGEDSAVPARQDSSRVVPIQMRVKIECREGAVASSEQERRWQAAMAKDPASRPKPSTPTGAPARRKTDEGEWVRGAATLPDAPASRSPCAVPAHTADTHGQILPCAGRVRSSPEWRPPRSKPTGHPRGSAPSAQSADQSPSHPAACNPAEDSAAKPRPSSLAGWPGKCSRHQSGSSQFPPRPRPARVRVCAVPAPPAAPP